MGQEETITANTIYCTIAAPIPIHNIVLYNTVTNKKVGELNFEGPVMTFEGEADESAKIFFECLSKYFVARLSQERDRAVEYFKKTNGL